MRTLSATVKALTFALFIVSLSAVAQAQATRTWVSGTGNDANPCSRTAPCKTFAGAISKTADKGEISVMDAGGYGAVTAGKNITIDGGGTMASILNGGVFPTNGVVVSDGGTNTIVVTLRNLSINGVGNGLNGIKFVSGKTLNVENCQIFGNGANSPDGAGIRVALTVSGSNVNVKNTSIFKNRVGITATTSAAGGNVTLNVNNCNIENNAADGIFLDARAFATVRNTNSSFNGGAGLSLNNGASNSATVEDSEFNHNTAVGLFVGTGTTVRLGRSLVSQNGANFTNSGSIVTFCNNNTETNPIPGTVTTNCQK
jgi:hypothetical protein